MANPHESADFAVKIFFTLGATLFGVTILYFGAKRVLLSTTNTRNQPIQRKQLTGSTTRRPLSIASNPTQAGRAPQLRTGQRLSRAARTSGVRSAYGRIPQDTVVLLTSHIKDVSGPVMSYLPLGITRVMRDWTIKMTLDVVFRDWCDNENLEILSREDVSDLGSFAEFSYDLAVGRSLEELGPVENAVYRASLTALLEHWLKHWNANGVNGPPK
ncbi:MAG: hypothetical protein K2X77_04635 [Candidatus Obscuribacterales bacterium]|nr:hypothetical protein [Candidatus Obscuribacterales bacterium]